MLTFFASILIWVMFLGIIFLWFYDGKVTKEAVIHAIIAAILGFVIAEIFKSIFNTSRPFEVNGETTLTIFAPNSGSFPSSHTAAAFATSVSLWFHDKKIGIIYLALALMIGIARVLSNVHFPIDISGGAVVGVLSALLIDRKHFFHLLNKRKTNR